MLGNHVFPPLLTYLYFVSILVHGGMSKIQLNNPVDLYSDDINDLLPERECDSIIASPFTLRGISVFCTLFWFFHQSLTSPDIGTFGRSSIKFSDVKHLVQSHDDKRLELPLKSTSCVLTIAQANNSDDIPILVNFVKAMKVGTKALLIIAPSLNTSILANMTINFAVRIFQNGKEA